MSVLTYNRPYKTQNPNPKAQPSAPNPWKSHWHTSKWCKQVKLITVISAWNLVLVVMINKICVTDHIQYGLFTIKRHNNFQYCNQLPLAIAIYNYWIALIFSLLKWCFFSFSISISMYSSLKGRHQILMRVMIIFNSKYSESNWQPQTG